MRSIPASVRILGAVLPILAGGGCASVFTDHAALMENGIAFVQSGQIDQALDQVCGDKDQRCTGGDRRLYLLEAGRISQLGGDFESSRTWFEQALDQFRADDRAALVEGHRVAAGAVSLVTNEKSIPYRPPAYERVFAHHFQALNYLHDGDLEGAAVEVRNAVTLQQDARKQHEEELEAYRGKLRQKGEKDPDALEAKLHDRMPAVAPVAGKAPSSFQNSYTWYLSGLVYEGIDDPGNALLSYRKAWEIWPDNRYLQQDILRLARREAPEAYREFKDRFPALQEEEKASPDCAEIILVVEQGFIPMRKEFFFALPISGQIVSTAFPYYDDGPVRAQACGVSWKGESQGSTEAVGSPQALAYRALEENMPALIVRALARGASKYIVADTAGDSGGDWVRFVANIANLITEQADLRSWYTLPASVQIWRGRLDPGEGVLEIRHKTRGTHWTLNRTMKPGEVLLVYLVDLGSRALLETMTLKSPSPRSPGSDPSDVSDPSDEPDRSDLPDESDPLKQPESSPLPKSLADEDG